GGGGGPPLGVVVLRGIGANSIRTTGITNQMPGKQKVQRMFHSDRGMHVEFENASTAKDFYDDVIRQSGWNEVTAERSIQLDNTFVIFTASKLKAQQAAGQLSAAP
ncbi:MAG: hypothetical protein AAGA83_10505, partial [Cyanobacteria bacterium P01_F01_bin.116]